MIDVSIAITVGVVFAALMVISYIIWTLYKTIVPAKLAGAGSGNAAYNTTRNLTMNSLNNITGGFDQVIKIIIIAVLVAVLAIALSYLMMLKQG
jgi:hypothetical protein